MYRRHAKLPQAVRQALSAIVSHWYQSTQILNAVAIPPTSNGTFGGSLCTKDSSMQTKSLSPPPPPDSPTNPALSQQLRKFCSQEGHWEQQMVGCTATWSPTFSPALLCTFNPISATVPENSWPKPTGIDSPVTGCGLSFDGIKVGVAYSWRSVPQMPTKAGALRTISRASYADSERVLHFDLVSSAFRFFNLVYSEVSRPMIS
jgi:hypothetical protein